MFKMTRLEFHFILQQYCTMDDKQAIQQAQSNLKSQIFSVLLSGSTVLLSFTALGSQK